MTYHSNMKKCYKRFQYRVKGGVKWTDWFLWGSENRDPIQLKGYKGDNLLNEYREE